MTYLNDMAILKPKPKSLISFVTVICALLFSIPALSWTRASLQEVHTILTVSQTEESIFETIATFDVTGGRFHGFDLAPQKNSELIKDNSFATSEDGQKYKLHFRTLFDGRTRIVLADKKYIRRGQINFHLIHKTNLLQSRALFQNKEKANLRWTPIIWDHGTNKMSVEVILPPGQGSISYDQDINRDYEITEHSKDNIAFKKFTTVKWYPMQVAIDFNPHRLAGMLDSEKLKNDEEQIQTPAVIEKPINPEIFSLWPFVAICMGYFLVLLRSWKIRKNISQVGYKAQYRFLRNTSIDLRLFLSFLAISIGIIAQLKGSTGASIIPLGIAAFLWLNQRHGQLTLRNTGTWRKMNQDDIEQLNSLYKKYKKSRSSILDATTLKGSVFLIFTLMAVSYFTHKLFAVNNHAAFALFINSILFIIPTWFSYSHSELPIDVTLESFSLLKKWKKNLSKLLTIIGPQNQSEFWIKEDEVGPVEIRLKANPEHSAITSLDLTTEVIFHKQVFPQIKNVAIIKVIPGTEVARELTQSTYAAEHHISPDLKQEIIVIRNRRGKKEAGLNNLKAILLQACKPASGN